MTKAFYILPTSKIYIHNSEIFQFRRLMVHENRNGVKLYDFVARLDVFGENVSRLPTSYRPYFVTSSS